jgi:hypothetical protein
MASIRRKRSVWEYFRKKDPSRGLISDLVTPPSLLCYLRFNEKPIAIAAPHSLRFDGSSRWRHTEPVKLGLATPRTGPSNSHVRRRDGRRPTKRDVRLGPHRAARCRQWPMPRQIEGLLQPQVVDRATHLPA